MPDFHQPDRADRAAAEEQLRRELSDDDVAELRRRAADQGVADADRLDVGQLLTALRASLPSNQHDPNWPDAPET